MLRSVRNILGYELLAHDGAFGRCSDFLFDDRDWVIRYMVADTGKWLPGRRVLISPIALEEADWDTKQLEIDLTKDQIESAPPLAKDEPVSQQFEMDYYAHYGWPYYWAGAGAWGPFALPTDLRRAKSAPESGASSGRGDPHLRSSREVQGYSIAASDRDIGHVEDLIVDDREWIIRYVVVDTRNWLPGRQVLIAPIWFSSIVWSQRKLETDLSAEVVKDSPEYDPSAPVNRKYERRLYDFYGRPVYWEQ